MDEMLILACSTPEETELHTHCVVQDRGSRFRDDGSFAEHLHNLSLSKYHVNVLSSSIFHLSPFLNILFFFLLLAVLLFHFSPPFFVL